MKLRVSWRSWSASVVAVHGNELQANSVRYSSIFKHCTDLISNEKNNLKPELRFSAAVKLHDAQFVRNNSRERFNVRVIGLRGSKRVVAHVESKAVDSVGLSSLDVGRPVVDSEAGGQTDDVVGDHDLRDIGSLAGELGGCGIHKCDRGKETSRGVEGGAEEHGS